MGRSRDDQTDKTKERRLKIFTLRHIPAWNRQRFRLSASIIYTTKPAKVNSKNQESSQHCRAGKKNIKARGHRKCPPRTLSISLRRLPCSNLLRKRTEPPRKRRLCSWCSCGDSPVRRNTASGTHAGTENVPPDTFYLLAEIALFESPPEKNRATAKAEALFLVLLRRFELRTL